MKDTSFRVFDMSGKTRERKEFRVDTSGKTRAERLILDSYCKKTFGVPVPHINNKWYRKNDLSFFIFFDETDAIMFSLLHL